MASILLPKPLGCLAAGLLLTTSGFAQLTITTQLPASNAFGVVRSSGIRIVTSQVLDADGAGALRVFSAMQGLPRTRGGQPLYAVSGNELAYSPATPWFPGEEVQVTVGRSLRSAAGQALQTPRVFRFRAAAGGTGRGYFVDREAVRGPGLVELVGVRLADLDGDGDLDLLAATPYDDAAPSQAATAALLVRLNDGTGQFGGGGMYSIGAQGNSDSSFLAVGDVDDDGDVDAVTYVHGGATRGLFTCLNDGSGRFSQTVQQTGTTNYNNLDMSDMDADGDLDLLWPHGSGGIRVWLNNGSGVYSIRNDAALPSNTRLALPADVDGDGDLDLLSPGSISNTANTLYIQLNNGQGTFSNPITHALSANTAFGGAIDIDRDGDEDLLLRNENAISFLVNDGRGAFTPGPAQQLPAAFNYMMKADLDSDGDLDLLGNTGNNLSVLFNNGDGTFVNGPQSVVGQFTTRLAAGDIDNDGDLDLVGITGPGVVTAYLNQPSAAPLAVRRPGPSAALAAEAYPNPYEQELNLRVQAAQAGPAQLNLYDAQGCRLWQQTTQLRAGANALNLPQLRALPTGLLLLAITQGGYQQVLKLEHR